MEINRFFPLLLQLVVVVERLDLAIMAEAEGLAVVLVEVLLVVLVQPIKDLLVATI